jgi:hypothetical protein
MAHPRPAPNDWPWGRSTPHAGEAGEVAADLRQLFVGRYVPRPTEGAAGARNRSHHAGGAISLICPVKINTP